jgi:hypothetical protein
MTPAVRRIDGARARTRRAVVALAATLSIGGALAACSTSSTTSPPAAAWTASTANPCDGLDRTACMLPFPDDYYTTPAATSTGLRLHIPPAALPRSASGGTTDTTPYERSDGFSPGSTLLTHIDGLDAARSGIPGQETMAASLAPDAPVVVLDATTGQRWPYWAETDATDPDASERLLMIHPARNFTDGQHYIVALRHLVTASGAPIAPTPLMAAALRGSSSSDTHRAAHEAHLRSLLPALAHAGVTSDGLVEAWDFTVASTQSLDGPALHMRDQTFAALGTGVPGFTVTSVTDHPHSADHPEEAGNVLREVVGTFTVPNYLSRAGGVAGSVLNWGRDGLPQVSAAHPTFQAPFMCEVPVAADRTPADPSSLHPARVGLYGHGLFGDDTEVLDSSVPEFSETYDYAFCATNWLGLSSADVGAAARVVSNLSLFPSLVDRLTQSLLDAQLLGRLLVSPHGFVADSAFQNAAHEPLINPRSGLVYYGNSEGGIMGGAFTALSTDVHRSVLGVPGMDYDVLLGRSVDFAPFLAGLNSSYRDKLVQQFGFDLLQTLWDRGEADGYAEHMTTDPLPGTPRHQVLLEEAFGDHQVANVQTDTEARTIGARIHEPALAPRRGAASAEFWGLARLPAGPATGPALYVWDSGVPAPPLTDVPASAGPDPHDTTPRSLPAFWRQMDVFFRTGAVIDPCGGAPCRAPYPPASS